MSSPQGTTDPQPQEGQGRPARKARVLDVVEYTHHDALLGRDHTGRGVVVALGREGEAATVVPLASHRVQVDPAQLTPLTAADVAES